jgi:hypothetical protein
MAKEVKTANELAAMIMLAAEASGKCVDLLSVVVQPTGGNHPTWDYGTTVNNPDKPNHRISAACQNALDLIVGHLQAQYDLSGS